MYAVFYHVVKRADTAEQSLRLGCGAFPPVNWLDYRHGTSVCRRLWLMFALILTEVEPPHSGLGAVYARLLTTRRCDCMGDRDHGSPLYRRHILAYTFCWSFWLSVRAGFNIGWADLSVTAGVLNLLFLIERFRILEGVTKMTAKLMVSRRAQSFFSPPPPLFPVVPGGIFSCTSGPFLVEAPGAIGMRSGW